MGHIFKCPGCRFDTDKKKSLSQHQRNGKCKGALSDAMASIILKRRDSIQCRREKELRRKEQQMDVVDEEAPSMDIVEDKTQELPVCFLSSRFLLIDISSVNRILSSMTLSRFHHHLLFHHRLLFRKVY